MQKLKNRFGKTKITWPSVLLLAVLSAIYTAVMAIIPVFKDTSFSDIAVYLEWWFLFAVFIIVNCEKWWEASLKCFVFFLISQPLIYLIQVPFSSMGWGLFNYYRYWFIITLLTLPGAAIAFQLKRKNWISVAVLSVATGYLAYQGAEYLHSAFLRFPRHLLSAIFCFALAVFFVFVLLDQKKHRTAAIAIFAAILAASLIFCFRGDFPSRAHGSAVLMLGEGDWTYSVDNGEILEISVQNGNLVTLSGRKNGSCIIDFTAEDGSTESYCVVVDGRDLTANEID